MTGKDKKALLTLGRAKGEALKVQEAAIAKKLRQKENDFNAENMENKCGQTVMNTRDGGPKGSI